MAGKRSSAFGGASAAARGEVPTIIDPTPELSQPIKELSVADFTKAKSRGNRLSRVTPTPVVKKSTEEAAPQEAISKEESSSIAIKDEDGIFLPTSQIQRNRPAEEAAPTTQKKKKQPKPEKTNAELEAIRLADSAATSAQSRLASTAATPGLRPPSGELDLSQINKKHTATTVWDAAHAAAVKLVSHFDNYDSLLKKTAKAHLDAADEIDGVLHGKSGALNPGMTHPVADYMRKFSRDLDARVGVKKSHDSLRNEALDALSVLRSLKQRSAPNKEISSADPFKAAQDSDRTHAYLKEKVAQIDRIHSELNKGVDAQYGIGSPLSQDEVGNMRSGMKSLLDKAGKPKRPNIEDPFYRHIDESVAEFEPGTTNLLNPNEALAPPGHVWVGEREAKLKGMKINQIGNRATVDLMGHPDPKGLIKAWEQIYGKQHEDVQNLKQWHQTWTTAKKPQLTGRTLAGIEDTRAAEIQKQGKKGKGRKELQAGPTPEAPSNLPRAKKKKMYGSRVAPQNLPVIARSQEQLFKQTHLAEQGIAAVRGVHYNLKDSDNPSYEGFVPTSGKRPKGVRRMSSGQRRRLAQSTVTTGLKPQYHEQAVNEILKNKRISPELRQKMTGEEVLRATVAAQRSREFTAAKQRQDEAYASYSGNISFTQKREEKEAEQERQERLARLQAAGLNPRRHVGMGVFVETPTKF